MPRGTQLSLPGTKNKEHGKLLAEQKGTGPLLKGLETKVTPSSLQAALQHPTYTALTDSAPLSGCW